MLNVVISFGILLYIVQCIRLIINLKLLIRKQDDYEIIYNNISNTLDNIDVLIKQINLNIARLHPLL